LFRDMIKTKEQKERGLKGALISGEKNVQRKNPLNCQGPSSSAQEHYGGEQGEKKEDWKLTKKKTVLMVEVNS